MKTYSIPILVSKNLRRRIKKKKRMKPNLLKNFALWTSKINLSNIPHIHVVNHYYSFNQYTDYPVNIAQKDDFNIIIPKTQGSMHIFSFAEMNNEGYL